MIKFSSQRFWVFITLCCIYFVTWAQAPVGYYDNALGKNGAALKTALAGIVRNHTVRSYKELWTDMQKTDKRNDGKVWDMYSSVTDFTFISDQCGNYGAEGDCYNREHSFPKSWFNDASPMYTDLFHLYPTDGYVNNRRSNYPFGETNGETYKSKGGFCKLGKSTYPGYTGIVFEPDDEYKGDFARSYFYMVTCYDANVSSWKSPMLNNTKYPAFSTWAMNMLLEWSKEDPVSRKEIDRNNAVYKIQKNRNPFIDHPELAEYIWGDKKNDIYDPTFIFEGAKVQDISVSALDGKVIITTTDAVPVRIYDVLGRVVRQQLVPAGSTEIALPSGMYIVNGRKILL